MSRMSGCLSAEGPALNRGRADVLTREDGLIHLSDWRAFAMPGAIQNGFLFDPVLDAMSETPCGNWVSRLAGDFRFGSARSDVGRSG